MFFVIDEDLPLSLVNVFNEFQLSAQHVIHAGLRGASDQKIAEYCQQKHGCLVTADYDFSDIRNYPPQNYHGLIILNPPKSATSVLVRDLVREFLKVSDIISALEGNLVLVEFGRIRVRKG